MRSRRSLAAWVAVAIAACAAAIGGDAAADLPPGSSGPVHVISNFGRSISPLGSLTQLGYFPIGAAQTPDGRFVWTVDEGRKNNDVQIVSTATGQIVQDLPGNDQDIGRQGGVAISSDGTRAYVSRTIQHSPSRILDRIEVWDINPATGAATPDAIPFIDVPPPSGAQPPDDFPPAPAVTPITPPSPASTFAGTPRSYPAGLALTNDGKTLVAALNLTDRVAVVNTTTRAVQQVQVRNDGKPGDHAYPIGVAIAGTHAVVTDEGDGTVAAFDVSNPSAITRVRPNLGNDPGTNPQHTHPTGIVASPDAKHVFVSLTEDDQVLELDAANPSTVVRRFDTRRAGGLGTQPVGMAVTPDGGTLFVADLGEDVVRAYALTARGIKVPSGTKLPPKPPPRARIPKHETSCGTLRRSHKRKKGKKHRKVRHKPCAKKRKGKRSSAARKSVARSTTINVQPGAEIARLPAGIYPRQVLVTPDSRRLIVVDSKGVGPGSTFDAGESVSVHVLGILQRIGLPAGQTARDTALVKLGKGGVDVPVPANHKEQPPAGSPLVGPNGGASQKIKYVFYVVMENKPYDTILGDLPRGNGDPCLAVFGEFRVLRKQRDGGACPYNRFGADDGDRAGLNPGQRTDGTPVTPNEHNLARQFTTLDNTYADSVTSDDGHIWTSSGYGPEYDLRGTLANNGPSPRPFDLTYPISWPPRGFILDAAVRQGVSFFNYGEAASGLAFVDPAATSEEQSTRSQVAANSEYITQYPSSAAINKDPITQRKTYDHDPGRQLNPLTEVSRMQYFRKRFQQQINACPNAADTTTCAVPRFNEMVMPNNHTAGTGAGTRTPDALVRDTDQAIGQLVSDVSHSKIWPYTAIFVLPDDAQGGADHIEGHRLSVFVASPYARRGAVVSTHYDQLSIIRTSELILGMQPTYLYDAFARPMWEVFQGTPDNRPYEPYNIPESLMEETNHAGAPLARESASYKWVADAVPENVMNRITWAYRYGTPKACPKRIGRVPYDPCADDSSDSAREVAKAKATIAALREIAAGRRPR